MNQTQKKHSFLEQSTKCGDLQSKKGSTACMIGKANSDSFWILQTISILVDAVFRLILPQIPFHRFARFFLSFNFLDHF